MDITLEQIEQMYQFGITISMWVSLVIGVTFLLCRLGGFFIDFIQGYDIDDFDNSCIIEYSQYKMGNHPLGILLDTVLLGMALVAGSLGWVLFWPLAILTIIAIWLRKRNLEARKIMEKLKGESESDEDEYFC